MQFQLPKPIHGWREFAGEVGIIVVGVLIALGAGQLVENWQWRHQTEQAQDAFKEELGDAAMNAYERLIVQPCLTSRLSVIANKLNEPGSQWRGMPEQFADVSAYYTNVLPVVYRAPKRISTSDAWSNALATGTINHLPRDRGLSLSGAYQLVHDFIEDEQQESIAESKLGPLGIDRRLSADTRIEMLQVISDLDRINNALATESTSVLELIGAANLGYNNAELQQARKELFKVQRDYRGRCVVDVPSQLN